MNTVPVETDVLVVGGGPVGLALGLDLRYRDVRCTIVERSDGTVAHPRVGTVGPRSMELFRRWGVASDIRGAGWPDDYPLDVAWVTAVAGHEIYRVPFGTAATRVCPPYTPEPDQVCPQHWLLPLLTAKLGAHPGGPVRLRHRLDHLDQHPDRVTATVTDLVTGAALTVEAAYVVACDGAASAVRRSLGVRAPSSHRTRVFRNILFEAPKLRRQLGDANALVYFLTSPKSLRYPLRAMDGQAMYRLTVSADEDAARQAHAPDLLRAAIAIDTPLTVLSDDTWHLTHRVADTFRVGRVFLAGDAAHTLSPSGGFGMNTGIADAADLGWKLAAALDGWAGPHLLDAYEAERRPVAVRSLLEANRHLERTLGRTLPPQLADDTPAGEWTRTRMAEQMSWAKVDQEFDAPQVHFGYRYDSRLVAPSTGPDAGTGEPDWQTAAVPGMRAPHVWLEPGRSTVDLFGTGFVLLYAGLGDSVERIDRAFAARGVPLTLVSADPEVSRRYASPAVLVRPDGHVAWCGTGAPADVEALADRVRGSRPEGITT